MAEDTPAPSGDPPSHAPPIRNLPDLAKVALGALGVVYGDIGTSPLYSLQECFAGTHRVAPTTENVLGILSLVFWSLTLVIVVKYLSFIMRADNQGEGGILALLALVVPRSTSAKPSSRRVVLIALGLFGAALLYGDGIITPAISVLSAVEGLKMATPLFEHLVVPLTVAILIGLFMVQRRGTAGIGAVFGPAMVVWFVSIAVAGAPWIIREPQVLSGINPLHAVRFFHHHGFHGFFMLGAVVLCITGGEALYADMGHFGKRPIRVAWYTVVFPCLLLNYFGQGALLLHHARPSVPAAELARVLQSPFYTLVPHVLLVPMVIIATVAAVIASQALISGAYSLTRQAVQLGYCPRVTIIHTSGQAEGQIYVPEINDALMVACVALVLGFGSSTSLGAAYGIAVTGTMAITSVLFWAVTRERWGWSRLRAGALLGFFLLFDLSFFAANAAKIAEGGWVPLVAAVVVFTLMTTWKAGRRALEDFIRSATLPLDVFMADLERRKTTRVKGTAVFMTSNPDGAPIVLLHHFKHNKVLHEQVVLLSVLTERVPEVPAQGRVELRELGQGFFQVTAHYGFMQTPSVPEILRCCREAGLKTLTGDTSFYLGRETLLTTGHSGMSRWRKRLFAFLSRNAQTATAFFGLPPNRVVELGTQIEL